MSETTTRTPDTSVILVCAGNATRMGGINKILMPLGNTNVIGLCMLAFEQSEDIAEIIVVTKAENNAVIEETAKTLGIRKLTAITEGGSTRQQSVSMATASRKGASIMPINSPVGMLKAVYR